MIQASELRVGNIISDIIGLEKHLVVYKIEYGIITCGNDDFNYPYLAESLKPIRLNITFEQAVKKALNTPLPKKQKNKTK
jgi:hypothetical protein